MPCNYLKREYIRYSKATLMIQVCWYFPCIYHIHFHPYFFLLLIFSICRSQIETELCNFSPPLCKWRLNMKACDKTENHGILEYICHLAISWFNHSSNIINWPQYSRVDLIFCTRLYAATAADFCWCNDLWITCQISLIVRIFCFFLYQLCNAVLFSKFASWYTSIL